jgi:hypothetical protein
VNDVPRLVKPAMSAPRIAAPALRKLVQAPAVKPALAHGSADGDWETF